MAGLQDLQDRVLWLSWGLKLDRITGLQDLQDLQDGLFKTKQGAMAQRKKIGTELFLSRKTRKEVSCCMFFVK